MADNKNQHYVPKVHLRPFSLNGEGRAINLFNLNQLRSIPNVPVKNQCSGNYFYGQDEKLESAINLVENSYGEAVSYLAERKTIDTEVSTVLRRFIYLQHLRTDVSARKMAEMNLALTDVPGSDMPVPSFREATKIAVQIAMLHFAEEMDIIDDLKLCIAYNKTDVPFVTSDNPSILTNRLYLQRLKRHPRGFGAKSAGALFFLPINPSILAILYDPDTYSVNHRRRWVDIEVASDAFALNTHQCLNCMANIYFREWTDRTEIFAASQSALSLRPKSRYSVVHAVLDRTTERGEYYVVRPTVDIRDGKKVLVHVISNHPAPENWPSFLRFRPDAKAWSNDTGAGLTRHGCLENGFVSGHGYRKVKV